MKLNFHARILPEPTLRKREARKNFTAVRKNFFIGA
jgi:hypothetical protein